MGIHSQLHFKTQNTNIEMIITLLLLGLAVKTVNAIAAGAEWNYYGCYEPKDSHYALHHSTFESDVMTTQSCANKCEASKYKLFGLDDGGHCLCDHSVEKAQKASEDKCEAQCQSEPGQKCGTGDAIRVLKILDESDAVFKWSDWSTWGSCSDTCGPNGKSKRFQNCKKFIGKRQWPANADKCRGQSQFDVQSCNTHIPCFVFKWSDWSGWNACTHTCGSSGKQKRFRKCLKITGGSKKEDAAPEKCPGRNHADIQSCNTALPCPVFKWNDWSQWSECTDTCGPDGKQKRTRQCKKITGTKHEVAQPSLCPGKSHSEEKSCNTGKKCAPKLKLTTCSQSSLHAWGDCHKAIDGNTNQDWYKKSCSHTNEELGWWKGSANQLIHVHSVRIYNRQECCAERLNNFVILVDGQECASYNSQTAFSVKRFKCDKMGREVMIKNRIRTALTLCEVEVFGEYIQNTHISTGCPPGTKEKVAPHKTCSCTPSSEVKGLGSLIFVIDISASMDNIIRAVKDNIRSIVAANTRFTNYIIGTFSDPYVKKLKKSTNVNEVKQFLDSLSAEGGGDCPEFAMSGALDAADVADHNSVMILFTDASAKDPHRSSDVFQKLKEKRIRFYAVLSKNMCPLNQENYDALAKVAHGQVANLQSDAFNKLMEFVKRAVSGAVSFSAFPTNAAALDGILRGNCACRTISRRTCEKTTTLVSIGPSHRHPQHVNKPSPTEQIRTTDCTQSSTILGGTCQKALDGNTNQNWNAGSCTHTRKEFGGWWKARLNRRTRIKEVKIFNRGDCCAERLNRFAILVDGSMCNSYNSETAFSVMSFKCTMTGREVSIVNRLNTDLTLCEVQIFGSAV